MLLSRFGERPDTVDQRRGWLAAPLELAPDDALRRFAALTGLHALALEVGDRDAADGCFRALGDIATSIRLPTLQAGLLSARFLEAVLDGDLDGSESLAQEVLEQSTAMGAPDALAVWGVRFLGIRNLQGRSGETVELIRNAIADGAPDDPTVANYRVALAFALAASGATDRHASHLPRSPQTSTSSAAISPGRR